MGMKFANNAGTTLAAGVAPGDLTLTVNKTQGANFPALGAGDYFYLTLQSVTTPTTIEVVKVTAVAGTVFTIVRAQDGTAAQSFNISDRAELRLVAATLNDLPKLDEANTFALAQVLQAALTVAGLLTAQGALTVQGALTAQALLTASQGLTFGDGSKLSTAAQLSSRNRLHNGSFNVNQRLITSPTVLAAGATGFDRWKAGAGGCTFSFAASGNGNIVTITAGSLIQAVEDVNVEGGQFALSNQGTAQARIAINGAALAGAFAPATQAAPLVSGVANAAQAISVEFSLGTIDRAQLEPGTVASIFERRPYQTELVLCQRYLPVYTATVGVDDFAQGLTTTTSAGLADFIFPVEPRVPPTAVIVVNLARFSFTTAVTSTVVTALTMGPAGKKMARLNVTGTGAAYVASQPAILFANLAGAQLIFTGAEL